VQAAGFVDDSGKMRTIPFEVMVQGDKAPVRLLLRAHIIHDACRHLLTLQNQQLSCEVPSFPP